MRPRVRAPFAAALLTAAVCAHTPAAYAEAEPTFDPHTGRLEPSLGELVKAAAGRDRVLVARLAARFSTGRLLSVLDGATAPVPAVPSGKASGEAVTPEQARAVLAAIDTLPAPVRFLEAVTPLLGHADRDVAEAAAGTLGRMLGRDDPAALSDWEVSLEAISRACAGLLGAAELPVAAASLRLAALDALSEARRVCPAPGVGLLRDPDPEIRRAAVLALGRSRAPAAADAVSALMRDDASTVASAATALACAEQPPGRSDPKLLGAVRALALLGDTPAEDTVDMVRCVAASNAPEDQRLLEALRGSRVPAIRKAVAEARPRVGR